MTLFIRCCFYLAFYYQIWVETGWWTLLAIFLITVVLEGINHQYSWLKKSYREKLGIDPDQLMLREHLKKCPSKLPFKS